MALIEALGLILLTRLFLKLSFCLTGNPPCVPRLTVSDFFYAVGLKAV